MADSKKTNSAVKNKAKSKAKSKAKKEIKRAGKSVVAQIMPVILLLVALFLLVCFVANLITNIGNDLHPAEHPIGVVGYYICEFFFGLFGVMAMFVPAALGFFALFWSRLEEDGRAVSKTVLASSSIVLTSGLVHIIQTLILGDELSYIPAELYEGGAALEGGGFIGGYVGFGFFTCFKYASLFVLAVIIGVLVCYLFGIKLHNYIGKLADKIKFSWENRGKHKKPKKKKVKPARVVEDDEDEDEIVDDEEEEEEEEEEDEEEIPVKTPKLKNKKPVKEKEPEIVEDEPEEEEEPKVGDIIIEDEDEDEDEEGIPVSVLGKKSGKKNDGPKNGDEDEPDEDIPAIIDDEDFEEEVIIGGKSHRIDEETGEVILESGIIIEDGETEYEPQIIEDDDEEDEGIEPAVREYMFPPIDLLKKGGLKTGTSPEEIEENKQKLREVLESFKIKVKEITCSCGPTITRYEIKPDAGVRVRAIANLVDDIAMALATSGVRIEAPIPGKAAVGVEVPNHTRSTVFLRSLIETPEFQNHKSKIASCLGADVSGKPVVFDIEKMPHLLVAGTTGSGKSVCINTIITSLLYRAKPDEVKLVLIDPKKVEFNVYRDIPHLSCKIVTDPKKAAGALNSAVNEMEKRFELIEEVGVRNITGYNEITKNDPDKPFMPRMVIIIDELADLMMTAPDEVETAICRIAQKARAAGIHLILGTQRPSVDVITGLIKANVPSRIAFTVTSSVDSRTIIDIGGAEKLTGMGDMLYAPVGSPKPQRVQGAFVSDNEVESIVDFIKSNNAPVIYDCEFEKSIDEEAAKCGNPASKKSGGSEEAKVASGDEDPKLYEAVELAIEAGKISTSLLQRKLEIGYGRAAKIIDRMEELGYVGPADGNKPRKILITAQDLAEKQINDNDDGGIFD